MIINDERLNDIEIGNSNPNKAASKLPIPKTILVPYFLANIPPGISLNQ